MPKYNWIIDLYGPSSKHIYIKGPGDFRIYVDYDDVDHYEIDELLGLVVKALSQIPDEEIDKAIAEGALRSAEAWSREEDA